jgi:phosphonate dehydrogenase
MLPGPLAALRACARVACNRGPTPWDAGELARRAARADALIAFMPDRVDAELLARCPRLRLVAGALKGADNIDAAACAERGVRVTVVEDLLSAPTAELAVLLTLGLLRHLRTGDAAVRGGHDGWRPGLYGGTLVDGTIGVLGMGSLGRAFARQLAGFGTRIVYHDPRRLPSADEAALRLTWVPADELPARCGCALVLLCPLTAASTGWLDATRLRTLAPGSVVVNAGRGSVVDEAAVLAALRDGRLAGYAADVFAFEDRARRDRPLQVDPELLAHPNTLFTPHLGSAVLRVREAIEHAAVQSVRESFGLRSPVMLGARGVA